MQWWGWVIVGFVCLAGEILTPGGFYLLFFGIAGIVVGILDLSVLPQQDWIDWLLFSVIAIFATFFLRPRLIALTVPPHGKNEVDSLAGQILTIERTLAPGQEGQAQFRGSPWRVRNVGVHPIGAGERAKVRAVNGITLEITAEMGDL